MKKWLILINVILLAGILSNPVSAASNFPVHWGFNKGKNEQQAEAGAKYDELLKKYHAFYKGNPNDKVLYLTFDNGYENGYTPKVLDVLKKEKVPAIFFVTGHYLKSKPDLVKRMVAEGHIVGNHSWSHPDLTQVSDEKLREELRKVKDETARITKQKEMLYLRPPRGILSERTMQLANDEGYTHVLWSLAFRDWNVDQQQGWKYSYDNIMAQVHPGAVMLLHTVSKDNADALEKVIKDLKAKGYQFKSLDDYMVKERGKKPNK
ncbi:delta-lactam-biosynthetic de-N-acetylase [Heyndrickxia oleronia]|uniref:Delta-lactam-biosynthetic de-N-acetylase n=1 Tax=Heyndrickxia oleronia TaxID=38875 RepID=A0A8E2IDY5_9BACI|nr:delta-lactam-biosynthetic de-N-acetylase [Heyndrickxia oleronia]MEC1373499.1 delta-lactam-biosynthetic de-N-acetylase [Heyndrickxia oleronia]OJH16161.1 delta-lactam-biosynthetic de-N-acetylase [Bacillus obstructivus]OOP69290.1 delta-lactam-biosynthetic de-N-acetylase [Heyndrickxia oleronia]QQZ04213.1 delta-lactam-biosynthetic de-N-acetylase [Heyndrickxia oleronia]